MTRKEIICGSLILLLVLLAYIIPFVFLTEISAWYGSFLFWTVSALLIIILNYILTKDWK
ncbi:hypothetical protein [Fredinandcohnia sp. 179-A 10B2 NHS]|uniref:hypothetical protein n=1 Tax=Fredinandcohnia sp. 179-A 10B2 NHS TaxID=3235176 RepID=UPI0039A21455